MAKKPTIKELQAEIATLKRSNAAYKGSASIEKSTLFKKLKSELAEAKADLGSVDRKLNKRNNEMLEIRRLLNINLSFSINTKDALVELIESKELLQKEKYEQYAKLNSVIEKQKTELAELKEKNAMQTKVIEEKEARIKELLAFNPSKEPIGSKELFESICAMFYYNPMNTSQADIHNAIVDLKAKYKEAVKNGKDVKKALCLPDDAKAEDILNAIDFYKNPSAQETLYKKVCEIFSFPVYSTPIDKILSATVNLSKRNHVYIKYRDELKELLNFPEHAEHFDIVKRIKELKKDSSEFPVYPLYINLCDEMGAHHGIKAEELIKKVKKMVEDNFKLITDNNGYKTLYSNLKSLLNLEGSTITIGTAIKNLQADLEAARKQEDKNALVISAIEKTFAGRDVYYSAPQIAADIKNIIQGHKGNKFKDVNLSDIIDDLAKKMSQEKFKKEYLAEDWPKESINIIGIKMPSGFHDGQTVTIHFK
jgi:hypothetical protein